MFTGTPEKRAQLTDYLAWLEGPASGKIPIKLRPRPTADASTRIVVTEYEFLGEETRRCYAATSESAGLTTF